MNRTTVFLSLLATELLLSGAPPKNAQPNPPPPKLLREINLNQIIQERPGLLPADHSVRTLAFSPDEKWIAIAVGLHRREGKFKPGDFPFESHVLILPLQDSPDHAIQLDPGAVSSEGDLVWSPNSDALLVQVGSLFNGSANLYNLRGDALWKLDHPKSKPWLAPWIVGFLDTEHLLAHHVLSNGSASGFDTMDLQGHVTDTWTTSKEWNGAVLNSDRHLLAVFSDQEQSKLLIVDYSSKKVFPIKSDPTWLYRDGNRSWRISAYFAESGKTICTVGSAESRDTLPQCWDADSGRKFAEYKRFPGGLPAAASAHGSRIVLTQGWFIPRKKDSEKFSGGRVVWDFRSGREVATLEAQGQSPDKYGIVHPAPIAISATGHYLAEGANGILRIYELP